MKALNEKTSEECKFLWVKFQVILSLLPAETYENSLELVDSEPESFAISLNSLTVWNFLSQFLAYIKLYLFKLSFSPHDGSERVFAQLQSNGPMAEAKPTTGNSEITSKSFLIDLANLERKLAGSLLDKDAKEMPIDNDCPEADQNIELIKAWKEVLPNFK